MKWVTIFAFALTAAAQERVFTIGEKVEFTFEGKSVTGAPYSAQAITETTQILADGNRITRKLTSLIARDSQGRTRREQNLGSVGPWNAPEGGGLVLIYDPVAGMRYTLEKNSKVAIKSVVMNQSQMQERRDTEKRMKQEARIKKEEAEANASKGMVIAREPKTETAQESLGTRMIEGVQAEGHRNTETIPAGRIGNEKPIAVVNETWYSPELQIVVMSKHSDPRGGDVVYTLTNINRAEPDPAMFVVPQDYRVREEGSLKVRE